MCVVANAEVSPQVPCAPSSSSAAAVWCVHVLEYIIVKSYLQGGASEEMGMRGSLGELAQMRQQVRKYHAALSIGVAHVH